MHYTRFRRHGDPNHTLTAPEGAGLEFLTASLGLQADECVEWPYSRDKDGYGQTFYEGRVVHTHRLVCRLTHGAPPSSRHQAAHSCGNAPCINKAHLRWRTPVQNIAEKAVHGTKLIGSAIPSSKLDDEKVRRILALQEERTSAVASEFGVSTTLIRGIWAGQQWRHIPRI